MQRRQFLKKAGVLTTSAALSMMGLGLAQTRSSQFRQSRPADNNPFASRSTLLQFRAAGAGAWQAATGLARLVPDTDRVVHTVELTGLTPDTVYEFRLPDVATPAVYATFSQDPTTTIVVHWHTLQPHPAGAYTGPFSEQIRKYRTFPAQMPVGGLRLAQISDTHGHAVTNTKLISDLAARGARVIIHSGDLATGNGGDAGPSTWYAFFDALNSAVDGDGCIVPIVPTLGNHEIKAAAGGVQWDGPEYGKKPNFEEGIRGDAEWYYSFFPVFPGLQGYGVLDFGNYLSVWQLDPGITTRWDEGQLDWLDATLAARQGVPHRLVSLHYSPWPPGRRAMASYFRETQPVLCPILEARGVRLVLTGHDHVLSKSPPITGGSYLAGGEVGIDPENGVVYIGAGPGGSTPRSGRNPHTKWWIEDSKASEWKHYDFEIDPANPLWDETRPPHAADGTTFPNEEVWHFWEIDLTASGRTVRAVDYNGGMPIEFTQAADPAL